MGLVVSDSVEEGWPISGKQRLDLGPDVTRVEVGEVQGDQTQSLEGNHHSSHKYCTYCMGHTGSDRLNILHRS